MMLFSHVNNNIDVVACNEDETESKDARESTTNDEKETVLIMLDWYPMLYIVIYMWPRKKDILRKKILLYISIPSESDNPLTLYFWKSNDGLLSARCYNGEGE